MVWMRLFGVVAAFGCLVSVSYAEEGAATSHLPVALEALGVTATDIVSEGEAHQIRGKSGCGASTSPIFGQLKSYCVNGVAEGTILLFEGVIGEFQYTNNDGMVIQGQFGGLQGAIGVDDGGDLVFSMQGKAYQETLQFAGAFEQHFSQGFGF